MKRSRTRSPGLNSPVQLPAGVVPFVRYVSVRADKSPRSVGLMRIWFHMRRLSSAALSPLAETSRKKSIAVGSFRL